MLTFPRLAFFLLTTIAVSAQQTAVITKCQDCSTKAAKTLQACMVAGGSSAANGSACQKVYQRKMTHCNKKWCSPKTTKVRVNTGGR